LSTASMMCGCTPLLAMCVDTLRRMSCNRQSAKAFALSQKISAHSRAAHQALPSYSTSRRTAPFLLRTPNCGGPCEAGLPKARRPRPTSEFHVRDCSSSGPLETTRRGGNRSPTTAVRRSPLGAVEAFSWSARRRSRSDSSAAHAGRRRATLLCNSVLIRRVRASTSRMRALMSDGTAADALERFLALAIGHNHSNGTWSG
jgi:hypothetical protein